ncbi:unnamed protein product [Leptosia nina]|uniref:Uncharacterized protein n=1 Tax=Leptosia nina TaxID=320188 RepID=A0AAV1JZM8_9NEOP
MYYFLYTKQTTIPGKIRYYLCPTSAREPDTLCPASNISGHKPEPGYRMSLRLFHGTIYLVTNAIESAVQSSVTPPCLRATDHKLGPVMDDFDGSMDPRDTTANAEVHLSFHTSAGIVESHLKTFKRELIVNP